MEHIAIMRKSWGLTQKIISGEKKIESRWYSVKYRPWNAVKKGETIYFKDSGEPVSLKATVRKVVQFSDLKPQRVKELLDEYGKRDGLERSEIPRFFERFRNKRYCMLVFLTNPKRIKPFRISKTGFGSMVSWITVAKVSELKA